VFGPGLVIGGDGGCVHHVLPVKRGGRFSKKAATPSM
jgi:hypothetical protein